MKGKLKANICKAIAGISGVMILISGCMLDSVGSTPVSIFLAGVALLGAAVLISPEVFE